jgi:hypothetical protein
MSETAELKRGEAFVFEDGQLFIKLSGHGKADGWGVFAFHERQIEYDYEGYALIEVPPSELRALRDFLTRVIQP